MVNLFLYYLGDAQPICLPIEPRVKDMDMVNLMPYVAGWGSTSYCN